MDKIDTQVPSHLFLHIAMGNLSQVEEMAESGKLQSYFRSSPALFFASINGRDEISSYLKDCGIDPNLKSTEKRTWFRLRQSQSNAHIWLPWYPGIDWPLSGMFRNTGEQVVVPEGSTALEASKLLRGFDDAKPENLLKKKNNWKRDAVAPPEALRLEIEKRLMERRQMKEEMNQKPSIAIDLNKKKDNTPVMSPKTMARQRPLPFVPVTPPEPKASIQIDVKKTSMERDQQLEEAMELVKALRDEIDYLKSQMQFSQ